MTTDDLRNIGLFEAPSREAERIKEQFGFPNLVDVVRLGFAYALAHDAAVGERDSGWGQRATNYNRDTIEGDERLLSALTRVFAPEASHEAGLYRAIEYLMNRGIMMIADDLRAGEAVSLSDLVGVVDRLAGGAQK